MPVKGLKRGPYNKIMPPSSLPIFSNATPAEREASRKELSKVVMQVRRKMPNIEIGKVWVHTNNGTHYEFHGPEKFIITVKATNAFAARAKGWAEFLKIKGIE